MSDLFVDTSYPLRPIKSLVSINYGKGLAAKIRDEKGKVPVYGSNGIIGYHSESITMTPIIIIGRKGTVGAVNFSDTNCWPIDTSFYIDEYPDDLEPKWLYHCLTSLEFGIHAQGPKPGIKRDLLYQTEIPVPSLNEQRLIAARIEELTRRAEEVRRLRQKAMEKVSTVMHAVIQSILGNSVDFVQTPIGNICSMKTGKTPPTKQIKYFDGDVLFVCPSDLGKSLKISKSERHLTKKAFADGKANLFKAGTVLLVGIGSTVGKVGIAECDLCTNQQITGIVFNDSVLPEYAVWYLSTQRDVIRNAAAGGGVPIINQQGISQLVIWHPNSIDAQRAIVRKLDALQEKLDELIAEQNSVDEELATFQSALLAKAFRGEL